MESSQIQRKIEEILVSLGADESSILSVTVVDSETMADINFKFRQKEGATNVLSFSQREAGVSTGNANLLGDVIVCWDRVASDSEALGYTVEEMFTYLVIHGILHIVGFD
ncbi:MAG: rRNA maturation RNase YbeY, partial [Desulfomonilaceae bacterium]